MIASTERKVNMKINYVAIDYDENTLGSFYGTAEEADSYFQLKYGDSYMGMTWEWEIENPKAVQEWGFYHKQCSKSMRHKLMDKIRKTYEIVGKQAKDKNAAYISKLEKYIDDDTLWILKDWNEFLLERQAQHE